MGKQSKNAIPCCLRCGKPVTEICRKTGKAGVKGEYRKWHLKCAASKCMKEKRLGEVDECLRIEKERDDRLLQAWLDRQDALESLSREIADYNEIAPGHDRAVVEMVYQLARQSILMFQINPMIPIDYGDDFRWLSAEIGSDGMNLIADSVHWNGVRRWNDDPDVSPEGRAPRTFMGRIDEPGERLEDEYTGDLDRKETTVTYQTALKHIWREDNIAGGRWADDRGPWTYK
jgi:hypothetical protein